MDVGATAVASTVVVAVVVGVSLLFAAVVADGVATVRGSPLSCFGVIDEQIAANYTLNAKPPAAPDYSCSAWRTRSAVAATGGRSNCGRADMVSRPE